MISISKLLLIFICKKLIADVDKAIEKYWDYVLSPIMAKERFSFKKMGYYHPNKSEARKILDYEADGASIIPPCITYYKDNVQTAKMFLNACLLASNDVINLSIEEASKIYEWKSLVDTNGVETVLEKYLDTYHRNIS